MIISISFTISWSTTSLVSETKRLCDFNKGLWFIRTETVFNLKKIIKPKSSKPLKAANQQFKNVKYHQNVLYSQTKLWTEQSKTSKFSLFFKEFKAKLSHNSYLINRLGFKLNAFIRTCSQKWMNITDLKLWCYINPKTYKAKLNLGENNWNGLTIFLWGTYGEEILVLQIRDIEIRFEFDLRPFYWFSFVFHLLRV